MPLDLDPKIEVMASEVIAAAIEVHRELGPGYLESVYERAMSVELSLRDVAHHCQHPVRVLYKGRDVGEGRVDILIPDRLVIELKAVDEVHPSHQAQVISYLKTTRIQLGLLINFNVPLLKSGLKRVVLSQP